MLVSEFNDGNQSVGAGADRHPQLAALEQLWERKRVGAKLPSKTAFPPHEIRPWLGHVLLVDVDQNPVRFRVRLMGVNLVAYAGTDHTGRWLDEIFDPEQVKRLTAPHFKCLETKAPHYDVTAIIKDGSEKMLLHRVHLPCADDGSTVNVILGCAYAVKEAE